MEGSQDVSSRAASHTLWEAARLGCSVQVLDPGNERYAEGTVGCVHTPLQHIESTEFCRAFDSQSTKTFAHSRTVMRFHGGMLSIYCLSVHHMWTLRAPW